MGFGGGEDGFGSDFCVVGEVMRGFGGAARGLVVWVVLGRLAGWVGAPVNIVRPGGAWGQGGGVITRTRFAAVESSESRFAGL